MEHKEFIKIWQTSSSMKEVVEKTGMGYNTVAARARRYRKKGIPLKPYPRGFQPTGNIDELKEYAQSFLNGNKQ